LFKGLKETEEGEYIMGGISDLVAALGVLGIMRAWHALEEDRKSRQEEAFVPFNLPPLPQKGQSIPQPVAEARPLVAVATSAPYAQSTL
jgi:hypothetical protein